MYFKITEIEAGWFDIMVIDGKNTMTITDSDYLSNNAPAKLLDNLITLIQEQTNEVWLCWHDEPGAYIWSIINTAGVLDIAIGVAKKDAWNIRGKNLSKEAISQPLIRFNAPLYAFAQSVVEEFEIYSTGEKFKRYETEWMEFPSDSFQQLKQLLRS